MARRMKWAPASMVCEVSVRVPSGTITVPADGYRLFKGLFDWTDPREHFKVAYLTVRRAVLRVDTISVGSLTASLVHPREVFRPAIAIAAAGVILAHNHPSGDPEPSADDIALTRRLASAGALLGIEVLDHLVIGFDRFVSLKDRGVL